MRRAAWVAPLTAVLTALGSARALAAPPDGDHVDRAVREILLRPEYAAARPSWLARLRSAVTSWVTEHLFALFNGDSGSWIAWAILAVAAVGTVALVIRLLRTVRTSPAVHDGVTVTTTLERSPEAWLAAADAARASGSSAEAVRCAYRALIAALATRGLVEEIPGRTVGEYRALLPVESAVRRPFEQASGVFERVWYAQRDATDADVSETFEAARRVGVRA